MRGIFFDEEHARAAAARLAADGWQAGVERERLAGEDDDEDHPWAVVADAPAFVLEMLVDEYDGWLDDGGRRAAAPSRRWTCRRRRSGSSGRRSARGSHLAVGAAH